MISLKFRDMIPQWAIDELDQLTSAIRAFLLAPTGQHNDDGSHADITAESITFDPILDDGVQGPQIVWNSPNGPLQIAGYDNASFGHVIDILAERKTFAGNQLNFVNVKAFSTPTGLTPAFSTLTVLATHVSGAPFRFIQMDSDKVQLTSGTTLNLDVGDVIEGSRTAGMGMFETYAPTWTNLTVGNGTVTSRVARVGKVVFYEIQLVFGSTTSISGNVIVSTPETINLAFPGQTYYFDSSAPAFYLGGTVPQTGTSLAFITNASPATSVTATVPFTWATSDQLVLRTWFEMP